MLSVKPRTLHGLATPDLLNWAAVIEDGVVVCKDGGLLAAYYYEGDDLSVQDYGTRNLASQRVKEAFAEFDSSWSIHVDSSRFPASPYSNDAWFPEEVTRLIDDARKRRYQDHGVTFETLHSIVLKWMPPSRVERGLARFVLNRTTSRSDALDETLNEFRNALTEFEDRFSAVFLLDRLGSYEYESEGVTRKVDRLLSHLRWMLTGEGFQLHVPLCPAYVDSILGTDELYVGTTLQLGSKFVKTVSVDGFPLETYPGILTQLDHLPIPYRWSTRYLFLDAEESRRDLKVLRNKWAEQTLGFVDRMLKRGAGTGGQVSGDAVEMMAEADEAMSNASSRLVGYGYYTTVIVLLGETYDEVQGFARTVVQFMTKQGFGARIDGINTIEAWLGSLPGHTEENVRRPLVDTLHLANLLPISSTWTGNDRCPSEKIAEGKAPPLIYAHTSGTTPYRLNLHVSDVGHTIVLGPTGAGKSTLLALICAQFRRYEAAKVKIFDKDYSLETLTAAVGGAHFDLSDPEKSAVGFCPLSRINEPSEREWAFEWIETLLSLQDIAVTPEVRGDIHSALEVTAGQDTQRTLSAFQVNVQNMALKDALDMYTMEGPYGKLLDSNVDALTDSSWSCFEVGTFLDKNPRITLPVLLYLFHRLELMTGTGPMLICMDEAWRLLAHEVFREKVIEWLRTMRKKNAAVLMATQAISDITGSEIVGVLLSSCPTWIFGADPTALTEKVGACYEELGLSGGEIRTVSQMRQKREYYIVQSGQGRRVVDFDMGPVELAFCGATSEQAVKEVRRRRAARPNDWHREWLNDQISEVGV